MVARSAASEASHRKGQDLVSLFILREAQDLAHYSDSRVVIRLSNSDDVVGALEECADCVATEQHILGAGVPLGGTLIILWAVGGVIEHLSE